MDDYTLKKKLRFLYIFCVLIPLIVTDSVILYIVVHSEQVKQQHAMENDASAVQYNLTSSVEYAASTAKNIYMNEYIEDFLNWQYETPLDYFVAYQDFMKDTLFQSSMGMDNTQVKIYADNETIVNGGEFGRLSSVKDLEWYQFLQESGQDTVLYFWYDDSKSPAVDAKRKVLLLRKMYFFGGNSCEKVVKVEIDYSNLVRGLVQMSYDSPIYICEDGYILLSNDGHSSVGREFEPFTAQDQVGYEKEMSLYGQTLQIYILKSEISVLVQIWEKMPLILLLILINSVLPWMFMMIINRSVTVRIGELSQVFESVESDKLKEIHNARGKDEIGSLMRNYNRMAVRTNELIQTVYKDRLKEQEMDIARQNAELLALHSQINPHFLFNALESIRMHSIIKQEYETADMVEKLAVMERQNVDWGTDFVEIRREMEFVEAYLGLQKYRFGDRLSYELDVEEDCANIRIPKLTVVTFVENACVHGIESKTTPGWIFVRIYQEEDELCIEVEDTGDGMDEPLLEELQEKMQNPSIDRLREPGHVGILNACLRLKMMTGGEVSFELESEKGVGTMVSIHISMEALKKNSGRNGGWKDAAGIIGG